MPELDKLVWTAGVAARVPGWIMEDRRSRTAFNRNFYRLYKDLPARELRAQARRRCRTSSSRGSSTRRSAASASTSAAATGHPGHRRAGLPRRAARAPRRRADRRAARRARRALHRRAGRAAADRRRPRDARRPPRRRPRRRPRRLPRLRRHVSATCRCSSWSATRTPINPDFRLAREARRRRWPVETWTTGAGRGLRLQALTYTPSRSPSTSRTPARPPRSGGALRARGDPPAARPRARTGCRPPAPDRHLRLRPGAALRQGVAVPGDAHVARRSSPATRSWARSAPARDAASASSSSPRWAAPPAA